MKRLYRLTIALCLMLLCSTQVMAQHTGPYIGAFFGGNFLMNGKNSDTLNNFSLEFDPALQGSGVLGWDIEPGSKAGEGRIELEYARRSNRLDKAHLSTGTFTGGGDITAESLIFNFIGVFHDKKSWAPYLGAGIGVARMEASQLTEASTPLASGKDIVLAYQFGIGIDFSLTEYLNLDLGYRFFSSTRPEFNATNGTKFKIDYRSHSAVLGVRVGF